MPFCTLLLAALGADVVKVEPPGAATWSAAGTTQCAASRRASSRSTPASATSPLDAKTPEGREVLRRLAGRRRRLLSRTSPPASPNGSASAPQICGPRTRGSSTAVSPGTGRTGRTATSRRTTCSSRGNPGFCSRTARPRRRRRSGSRLTDQIAGVHAALGIAAALHRRERTGEGAYLDVSMLESAAFWLAYYPHHWWHRGRGAAPLRHAASVPLSVRAVSRRRRPLRERRRRLRRRLATLLRGGRAATSGRTTPASPPSPPAPRRGTTSTGSSRSVIATAPAEEWAERLQAARLPVGRVRTIGEVVEHPQLVARGPLRRGRLPRRADPRRALPAQRARGTRAGPRRRHRRGARRGRVRRRADRRAPHEGRRVSAAAFDDLARRPAG